MALVFEGAWDRVSPMAPEPSQPRSRVLLISGLLITAWGSVEFSHPAQPGKHNRVFFRGVEEVQDHPAIVGSEIFYCWYFLELLWYRCSLLLSLCGTRLFPPLVLGTSRGFGLIWAGFVV